VKSVTVKSRNYDGSIRRSWLCELIELTDDRIVLAGKFESDVGHPDLGLIMKGTVSHEYFWFDKWYNVFRFHEPDGRFRNFYCNLSMPPVFSDGILEYVDLDIDVVVWPDHRVEVLDREEFKTNVPVFGYTPETIGRAEAALEQLKLAIERGEFPFDSM
jgi:uncharacterized protein